MMQERTCKCGTKFQPKRGNHIHCGPACANRVTTERRRVKPHNVVCDVCGAKFQTNNPSTKRCQPECARAYRSEYHRRRERIPCRPKGALGWEEVFSWRYTESN